MPLDESSVAGQPKNTQPFQRVPGDGARDSGQRLVGPALPFEATGGDADDALDALPFAQEARARDRAVAVETHSALLLVSFVQFLAQPLQPADRLRFQPATGEFLDAIADVGPRRVHESRGYATRIRFTTAGS